MLMRFNLLLLILMAYVPLAGQEALAPGMIDTVTIPGAEVSFPVVYLPGGTVTLEVDGQSKEVQVDPFWMGVHEVTWEAFTFFKDRDKDSDASNWQEDTYSADAFTRPSPPYTDITFGMGSQGALPAVSMTQQSAMFYCLWVYMKTGEFFRLPTEAEWTYACLAGSGGALPEGVKPEENMEEYAWYYGNSEERYHEVGRKKPNPWGLHDMLGNVSEWTLDQYDVMPETLVKEDVNPWAKPAKRYGRTVKGGSFDDEAGDCNCQRRIKSSIQWQKRDPQVPKSLWWNTDSPFVGFRMVKPAKPMTPEEIQAFFEEAVRWE